MPPQDWNHQLQKIREKVAAETLRHLRALADLNAEEKRIKAEMVAERQQQRLQKLSSARTVVVAKMRSASAKLLPDAPGFKTGGRRTKSDHPFALALTGTGTRLNEWAAGHGVDEATVKAWIKPAYTQHGNQMIRNPHVRRIPRVFADLIQEEFGLPADEDTWPQGIRDKA